ncbi:MAG: DUF4286 family protein [Bacteroides sp.]
MIIYNTTFHIEKEAVSDCVNYLKECYIPQAATGGFLHSPCLRRVLQSEEGEGESYAVQFLVKNTETLNYWLQNEGAALHRGLLLRFGQQVVGFTTLLEEIVLEE